MHLIVVSLFFLSETMKQAIANQSASKVNTSKEQEQEQEDEEEEEEKRNPEGTKNI